MTSAATGGASGPDSANCFEKLKQSLKADALFAATGGIGLRGAANIVETLAAIGIPADFAEKYRPLAEFDVVGMLFAADPRIAERISASDYERVHPRGDGQNDLLKRLEIRDYLRNANFEHLLLAGLDSALYGRAWVVAYRSPSNCAFSDKEMEIARYTVPSVLFELLRARHPAQSPTKSKSKAAAGNPLPLNAARLRIAILEAQGYGAKAIGQKVCKDEGAVANDLSDIRRRLGVSGRRITLRDLEYFDEVEARNTAGARRRR